MFLQAVFLCANKSTPRPLRWLAKPCALWLCHTHDHAPLLTLHTGIFAYTLSIFLIATQVIAPIGVVLFELGVG